MKKGWRVIASVLTLVLAAGLLLTGCNKGGTTSGETKEILWCVVGDETKDSAMVTEKMNEILEEKLNLRIKFKYLTTDNYDLVLQSGEAYDIICAPDWLGYWDNIDRGAFAEITDEDLQTNAPYIWENGQQYLFAAKADGKLYGIPGMREYAPDRCYAARGDLMDKYGIPDLNTVDNVEKYLLAVADNEENIIPFDMPGTTPYFMLNMWASDWGWAAVGTLSFGEHVYFRLDDPERKLFIAVDQPESREFSLKMKEWMDRGVFSKSVLSNKVSSTDSFKNGRSALCWLSNPEECNRVWQEFQQDDRKKWDVRFYPVYSKTQRMYNYLNSVVSISNFSNNKADALKVLNEFYANEELYNLLARGIKGTHWDVDSEGYYQILDNDSYSGVTTGVYNMAYDIPTKLVFPGADELVAKLESFRVADPIINCNVNMPELKEIKVSLDEVYWNYTAPRCYGAVDDVDQAIADEREALKNAGIDQYVEVLQKRLDEFAASLDE